MLQRLAHHLTLWSTRWVPDAFVIAAILTVLTAGLVLIATPSNAIETAQHWGDGLWVLLSFGMQMCIIMTTGYIVAVSKPVVHVLERLAETARSPRAAVTLTALVAMLLCAVNWGVGLITSAVFVRAVAKSTSQRNIAVDYRLLVACAYLGMATTWHAGLSGSAPLLMATPGHFLEASYGIIATQQTIFSPFNLGLLLVVIIVMAMVAWFSHPNTVDDLGTPSDTQRQGDQNQRTHPRTPAERLEHSPILSLFLGALGIAWLANHFGTNGFSLTLNVVNLIFLTLGILLHWTPASFLDAAKQGGGYIWGVVIQFPLYAGIFGMVKYSGLQNIIADGIVAISTAQTFPLLTYWYSGFLNYIVPSGGGQWAIQAPVFLEAGAELGVPHALTVLAYAWGDMMTDAIQPFWAIPLLGITGTRFRDMMGYALVFFLVYASLVSVAFLMAPTLF